LHISFLEYASSRSVTLTVGFKPVVPLRRDAKLKPKIQGNLATWLSRLPNFRIGVALKTGRTSTLNLGLFPQIQFVDQLLIAFGLGPAQVIKQTSALGHHFE
jgi:hypothetical protein